MVSKLGARILWQINFKLNVTQFKIQDMNIEWAFTGLVIIKNTMLKSRGSASLIETLYNENHDEVKLSECLKSQGVTDRSRYFYRQ